jgi:ubiquinol-cytochrome c reductase cytochrome b/c1 subunit
LEQEQAKAKEGPRQGIWQWLIAACIALIAVITAYHFYATVRQHSPTQQAEAAPRQTWSFAGPLGIFDAAQLRRGFKIYRESCGNCHSMKELTFRNLAERDGPGFSETEAEQIAASFRVTAGPNEQGEMYERPGRISDHFPSPFPNDEAARVTLGFLPPDMSNLANASGYAHGFPWFVFDGLPGYREAGPDYVHAILTGYGDTPAGFALPVDAHYNRYFPGHAIRMPPPVVDGQFEYPDGAPTTVDQYSRDIAAFSMWAAVPDLDARKRLSLGILGVVSFGVIALACLIFIARMREAQQSKKRSM